MQVVTQSVPDQAYYIISGIVAFLLAISSVIGVNALYKDKVIVMRRLSIVFIILTVIMLITSLVNLSVDISTRDQIVDSCYSAVEQSQDANTIDCRYLVKLYLIRESITLFLLGIIQTYFAYVVLRHARSMGGNSQYPYPLANKEGDDLPPTYFVYASQGVPTADNWVPPPTYNGNPNNIPVTSDVKYAENAANHA
ncbi:7037_t:CDS:2 [Ambispora leptoticha]|uniref:7037_t:CDS:1 n=1 Tax=Ambispora leptoticha TaxID=144679 RepID=A0A9N9D677_9GLOM|nr:7037_t:CDS:2 [Ambispora leptoticha]